MTKKVKHHAVNKLTVRSIAALNTPGKYADGLGLYLEVKGPKVKAWCFRYMIDGKARQMQLGATHTVSLPEAREAALAARKLVRTGIDPLGQRHAQAAARAV